MQILFNNKQIEVEEVEVVTSNEPWSEYRLIDGTLISCKAVLISIFKATTEKSPDGAALYVIKSQNIVKSRESRKN